MKFRLRHFPQPLTSQHPRMPAQTFDTEAEARAAAASFVGSLSAGGHDPHMDLYWGREDFPNEMHASTSIIVERVR